jgi:hypothetical protein
MSLNTTDNRQPKRIFNRLPRHPESREGTFTRPLSAGARLDRGLDQRMLQAVQAPSRSDKSLCHHSHARDIAAATTAHTPFSLHSLSSTRHHLLFLLTSHSLVAVNYTRSRAVGSKDHSRPRYIFFFFFCRESALCTVSCLRLPQPVCTSPLPLLASSSLSTCCVTARL